MKKFISFFTTVVLLAGGLGLFAQNAAAQTKVTGTIVDASGIGIPGATVIQEQTTVLSLISTVTLKSMCLRALTSRSLASATRL